MDQLRWLAQAGKGATAYVFKAADGNTNNYAVKVRKPAIASTSAMEDVCRAFEGKNLAKVCDHRNIVTLHTTAFDARSPSAMPEPVSETALNGSMTHFLNRLGYTQWRNGQQIR